MDTKEDPSWADLHMFLLTARGTLASAARRVGVHPSTVQRRIVHLETALGVRLFDRSGRAYTLTESGETLLARVGAMESEVLAAHRELGGADRSLEGAIHVQTVDDVAIHLVLPLLAEFREQYARLSVELSIAVEFVELGRYRADVALRFGLAPDDPNLVAHEIASAETALYGLRGYFDEHPPPQIPAELRAHPIVCGGPRLSRLPMERFVAKHVEPHQVVLRSDSMLTRYHAVRRGLGIGYLPLFLAEQSPDLQRVDLGRPQPGASFWMLVHTDLRQNARVRAFVDFALPRLREAPLFRLPPG